MTETRPELQTTGYRCPECEYLHEEEPEVDPWYECDNCGNAWPRSDTDSHRCEQCGKFAAKAFPTTCPECQAGIDGYEEVTCVVGDDGTLYPLDEEED